MINGWRLNPAWVELKNKKELERIQRDNFRRRLESDLEMRRQYESTDLGRLMQAWSNI